MAQRTMDECGCCGHWHWSTFTGDCRDDANRFDTDTAEALAAAEGADMVALEDGEPS